MSETNKYYVDVESEKQEPTGAGGRLPVTGAGVKLGGKEVVKALGVCGMSESGL